MDLFRVYLSKIIEVGKDDRIREEAK